MQYCFGAGQAGARQAARAGQKILKALPASDKVIKVEIAGPGFINFFLRPDANHGVIRDILDQRAPMTW